MATFQDPIKILNAQASSMQVDRKDLKRIVQSANLLYTHATGYWEALDLERAYVMYMRFTEIAINVAPTHKDAGQPIMKESMGNLRQKAKVALSRLELLKEKLKAKYDVEQKEYLAQQQKAQEQERAPRQNLPLAKAFSFSDIKSTSAGKGSASDLPQGYLEFDTDSSVPPVLPSVPARVNSLKESPASGASANNSPSPVTPKTASDNDDEGPPPPIFARSTSLAFFNVGGVATSNSSPRNSLHGEKPLIGTPPAPAPSVDRNIKPGATRTHSSPPVSGALTSSAASAASGIEAPPPVMRNLKPSYATLMDDLITTMGTSNVVRVPSQTIPKFLEIALPNTQRNLETCGILTGRIKQGSLNITHILVPKQTATSDSCTTLNEEDLFAYQEAHNLMTLGWIHTHPTQTCFMSSVDLHTHCSYQLMLPEAIAIVCAPSYDDHKAFCLTQPYGLQYVADCDAKGFHPHPENPPLYEKSGKVIFEPTAPITVVDLR